MLCDRYSGFPPLHRKPTKCFKGACPCLLQGRSVFNIIEAYFNAFIGFASIQLIALRKLIFSLLLYLLALFLIIIAACDKLICSRRLICWKTGALKSANQASNRQVEASSNNSKAGFVLYDLSYLSIKRRLRFNAPFKSSGLKMFFIHTNRIFSNFSSKTIKISFKCFRFDARVFSDISVDGENNHRNKLRRFQFLKRSVCRVLKDINQL